MEEGGIVRFATLALIAACALAACGEYERPALEIIGFESLAPATGSGADCAHNTVVDISADADRLASALVRNNTDRALTPLQFHRAIECDSMSFIGFDQAQEIQERCVASTVPPRPASLRANSVSKWTFELVSADFAEKIRATDVQRFLIRAHLQIEAVTYDGSIAGSNELIAIVSLCDDCVRQTCTAL